MMNTPAILQNCLAHIAVGETSEQVLARYPAEGDQLAPLLALAADVRATSEPMPSAAKARLRVELQGALRARQLRRRYAFDWRVWTLRVALTVLVVLLFGGSGLVAVAQAKPGDMLYPVRLAVNETQVQFVGDPRAALQLRLQIVTDRLDEAEVLFNISLWGPQEMLQLLDQTSSTITFMELNPQVVTRDDITRMRNILDRERKMVQHALDIMPPNRPGARRSADAMLQVIASWGPSLERLVQQIP